MNRTSLPIPMVLAALIICPAYSSAEGRDCQELESVRQKFSRHFDTEPNYTAGYNTMSESLQIFLRMKQQGKVDNLSQIQQSALKLGVESMTASQKSRIDIERALGARSPSAFISRESEVDANRFFIEAAYAFMCK